jgi:CrcB protein
MNWRLTAAVGAGGGAGALVRAGLLEVLDDWRSAALLAVNVGGSFLLGMIVVRFVNAPTLRAGLGTGFCGALTSMSTFAVDVAWRLDSGQLLTGAVLAAATVALAVGGALLGFRLERQE